MKRTRPRQRVNRGIQITRGTNRFRYISKKGSLFGCLKELYSKTRIMKDRGRELARSKNEVEHSIDVADRIYQITGDLELAIFALCHHSTVGELEPMGRMDLFRGVLNPFDFMKYGRLRRADVLEDRIVSREIYSDICTIDPRHLLLRATDIASLAGIERSKLEDVYSAIEYGGFDFEPGLLRIEHAIEEVYLHVAERLGQMRLARDLQEVRVSITHPTVFNLCDKFLQKNMETLRIFIEEIDRGIMPVEGEGGVIRIRSRIKRCGSLAVKLVDKTQEAGEVADQNRVVGMFLANVSAQNRLRSAINDLAGFEVTVEDEKQVRRTVSQIRSALRRKGFTNIEIEERNQQFKDEGSEKMVYIIAQVPKKLGEHRITHKWKIEIQVQTKKTAYERTDGEYYHAGYKGCVLTPYELRNIDALGDAIGWERLDNEGLVNGEEAITRNLVSIRTGQERHLDLVVPFPTEVLLIDIMASTIGVPHTAEVLENILDGTRNGVIGTTKYENIFLINHILGTWDRSFQIVYGERIDIRDPRCMKALERSLRESSSVPRTLAGRTAWKILFVR